MQCMVKKHGGPIQNFWITNIKRIFEGTGWPTINSNSLNYLLQFSKLQFLDSTAVLLFLVNYHALLVQCLEDHLLIVDIAILLSFNFELNYCTFISLYKYQGGQNVRIVRIVRIFFQIVRIVRIFILEIHRFFFIFTHFSKFFMKIIKKKFSSKWS